MGDGRAVVGVHAHSQQFLVGQETRHISKVVIPHMSILL